MNFLFVGAGGALGAIFRYSIGLIPYKGDFPVLTLVTNLLGAFFIGFISGAAEKKGLSDNLVLFLKTGVCGGFTTFSTFSLESYRLIQSNHLILAVIYVVLSVGLCLAGVFFGMFLAKKIF